MTPKTPNDMPSEFTDNQQTQMVRNAFLSDLLTADSVDIHYEPTSGNDDDKMFGEWSIEVHHQGDRIEATHESFVNVLWFALEHMKAGDRSDYTNWEKARSEALSKLSKADRSILGLE